MIRDKLVFGIKDDTTKQKILSREDLQLKQAINISQVAEASRSEIQASFDIITSPLPLMLLHDCWPCCVLDALGAPVCFSWPNNWPMVF